MADYSEGQCGVYKEKLLTFPRALILSGGFSMRWRSQNLLRHVREANPLEDVAAAGVADISGLPSFAEMIIAHAKLSETVEKMPAVVEKGTREALY